jgi:hypothetical protein
MIDELWGSFPRLLEQNINGLLDTAEPNPTKAFQLYKACKNEDLWRENFETFSRALREFYSRPRGVRRKSEFDRYLDRPMDADVYSSFHLNFRTASVDDRAVTDLASWAHNLIRVSKKSLSAVFSLDVMTKTLRAVVMPGPLDKAENIEFDDVCDVWKKVVSREFGSAETRELNALVGELQKLNDEHRELEEASGLIPLPLLQMTPDELGWIKLVRLAALAHAKIPKPPRAHGVRKQCLKDLDRVIQLYEIVLVTALEELLKHRESTRLTLIDRCDNLLSEAEPRAA